MRLRRLTRLTRIGVLLALPIGLLARSLGGDLRRWPKVAWTAGTILVAIPRQTLLQIAPPPVMSLQGLAVIALPMWGALLLLAASLALSQPQRSPHRRSAAHAERTSWRRSLSSASIARNRANGNDGAAAEIR